MKKKIANYLHVESRELPKDMMYLNRIILVIHALELLLALFIQKDGIGTHKDPRAKMKHSAIFFLRLRFRSFSSEIGNNITTKSSAIANPAPLKIKA